MESTIEPTPYRTGTADKPDTGATPAPLLTTKLHPPPSRPEFVPRARLVDRLHQGLSRKLTLISAQAGFGKTTLVSNWVRQLEPPTQAAWLSVDEADNDPVRFWLHVAAADADNCPRRRSENAE